MRTNLAYGIALGAACLGAAACSSGSGHAAHGGPSTGDQGRPARAALTAMPDGSVTLSPAGKAVSAVVHLFGLAPNSEVTLTVDKGSCLEPSDHTLLTLGRPTVSADGTLSLDTKVTRPATSNGEAVALVGRSGGATVGCTDLGKEPFATAVRFFPPPSQRLSGSADLNYDARTGRLTGTVRAVGVTPGAKYAAALYDGSCAHQRSQVAALATLTGTGNQTASGTVSLDHVVSVPSAGWSVQVSRSPGGATVACGDLSSTPPSG